MKKLHFGSLMDKANDQLVIDVVMVTQRRPRPQVSSPIALDCIPNQSNRSELTAPACSRLLTCVECGNTFHIARTLARTSTYPAVPCTRVVGPQLRSTCLHSNNAKQDKAWLLCCTRKRFELKLTKFPWHDTWFCSNDTLIKGNQCGWQHRSHGLPSAFVWRLTSKTDQTFSWWRIISLF